VELNRAVALSMAFGPAAGLELVDARVVFQRTASLTKNAHECRALVTLLPIRFYPLGIQA
jgi:predicted RNA polymerase sigma factor